MLLKYLFEVSEWCHVIYFWILSQCAILKQVLFGQILVRDKKWRGIKRCKYIEIFSPLPGKIKVIDQSEIKALKFYFCFVNRLRLLNFKINDSWTVFSDRIFFLKYFFVRGKKKEVTKNDIYRLDFFSSPLSSSFSPLC